MISRNNKNVRDALLIVATSILFFLLAGIFDLFENLINITRGMEFWQVDEVVPTLIVISLCMIWFARRRCRDLKNEVSKQMQASEELAKHRDHLEDQVSKHTFELEEANRQLLKDITERKQMDESLRKIEAREAMVLRSLPMAFYVAQPFGDYGGGWVSEQIDSICGFSASDFKNDAGLWASRVHPYDRERVIAGFDKLGQSMEYRWQHANDEYMWLLDHAVLIRNDAGDPKEIVGTWLDITERKIAEEALEESRARYQELFDSLLEGICVADENENILFCNPAFAALLEEEEPANMIGRSLLGHFASDQKRIILEQTARRKKHESSQYELEIVTAKNDRKVILVSVSPRLDSNGGYAGGFGNIIDITETRRLQELESRAQRLETAGQIAGQVAHDFNNLLAPLMAYPELIREELSEDHPVIRYLGNMENAATQIADINQQLLTLGRRGHYNQQPVNLNEIVLEVIKQFDWTHDRLVCRTELDKNLMCVMGCSSQIYRLLMNLIVNARDAMQDVGQISIKSENFYVDKNEIAYGRISRGEYVKLTISDTGCGISDDIVQKIFDPFFTSKTTSKKRGSGLGLSVVDSVVKDHKGYLDISTRLGEGTSFYLYFPITRESAEDMESAKVVGGSETVLVVDDDEVQREVSLNLLQKLGYNATAVESGEEAVEFLEHERQDLLILDMIMPNGIDGTETYRRALKLNPDQKAMIVSGYAESNKVQAALDLGAGGFIRKPLTHRTIATAVRRELDREVEMAVL